MSPAICAMAHAAGAVTCVDGVSYAPHGLPDVGALGADIYLFSAYKTYGPHQGIMVIRRALAEALPNQGHYFNGDTLYKRFTPAGPDHAQIAACAGIADYIDELHAHHFKRPAAPRLRAARVHDLMRAREIALLQPLLDFLAGEELGAPARPARCRAAGADGGGGSGPRPRRWRRNWRRTGSWPAAAISMRSRPLQRDGHRPGAGVLRLSFVHYTSRGRGEAADDGAGPHPLSMPPCRAHDRRTDPAVAAGATCDCATHPALRAAADDGRPVMPVFIRDEIGRRPGRGAEMAAGGGDWSILPERLEGIGLRLVLRSGPALEVLGSLADETGAVGDLLVAALRRRRGSARQGGEDLGAGRPGWRHEATTRICCSNPGRSRPGRASPTRCSRRTGGR